MLQHFIKFSFLLGLLNLSGCASIVNDNTHSMRVDTLNSDGEIVEGAKCELTNDYGTFKVESGESLSIRRSDEDLDIVCNLADYPEAKGTAISRANAGLFGNILFGGGVGAIIDHTKGTAYTYPTWIQLIFGRFLVFDRSAEKEGQPTPGMEPTTSTKK